MDSTGPDRPDAAAGSEAAADGDADGAAGAGTAAEAAAPGPSGGGSGGRISVGLVLSAGGAAAEASHRGAVRALHEVTGWDARSADLMLGPPAGALTVLRLPPAIPPPAPYPHRRCAPARAERQALLARAGDCLDDAIAAFKAGFGGGE